MKTADCCWFFPSHGFHKVSLEQPRNKDVLERVLSQVAEGHGSSLLSKMKLEADGFLKV